MQAPHPFDTLEGQAALTSPFAAGAFATAGGRSDSSSGAALGPGGTAGAAGAAGRGRRGSRERGPHDSADTRSSRSTLSRSSLQSYMAKCARIETKSMQPGQLPLPPAASADLAAAVEGAAGSSSVLGGSSSTAGPAGGSGLPPLPQSPTPGRQPARPSVVELQPLGGLTPEEAAALAEGGDVLGAAGLLPLRQAGRISSEEVRVGTVLCAPPVLAPRPAAPACTLQAAAHPLHSQPLPVQSCLHSWCLCSRC